jgi:hypothetical protein
MGPGSGHFLAGFFLTVWARPVPLGIGRIHDSFLRRIVEISAIRKEKRVDVQRLSATGGGATVGRRPGTFAPTG